LQCILPILKRRFRNLPASLTFFTSSLPNQCNRFTHVQCTAANTPTVNISAPDILIPADFNFDNFTVSLDKSYIVIDHILTKRLPKLRAESISYRQLHQPLSTTFSHILHLHWPLSIFCICINHCQFLFGRICRTHQPLQLPTISLSTRKTTTPLFFTRWTFLHFFTFSHLTLY